MINMPRYFVEKEDMHGEIIFIKNGDAKHLGRVLRAKAGDIVEVCDGDGMDYSCVVVDVKKDEIRLEIESATPCQSEPETSITLFQAIPKGDKMETVIQKCVEIGVCRIVPVAAERCVSKPNEKDFAKKRERWQKISLSASKQSGRGRVPEIGDMVSFKEAAKMCAELDGAAIAYEKEEKTGLNDFVKNFSGKSLGLFIGPEGGFSEEEIKTAQLHGASAVSLGRRILRTETAGMAAAAILLYELG